MGAWIWVRYMVGGVGGMWGSFCSGDHLGYGKFCKNRILTGFLVVPYKSWLLPNNRNVIGQFTEFWQNT